ncbi:MAG: WGR domain-containing protein [Proteobacteria bacterium]|nr:WGR domain-containing protein [Pseudomonadota bacterium]
MSDTWKVHLVFADARSNKFWRARTDGHTLYVNYGRVGSSGQTQIKEFDSPQAAQEALEKQASGKRRKGYADEPNSTTTAENPSPDKTPAPPSKPQTVTLTLDQDGRNVELSLRYDGKTVRTEVTETYLSAEQAAAAFVRIQQAMSDEGYKKS